MSFKMTYKHKKIKRNRARCRKCKTVIESKHRHDYVGCKCGAIAVDGGKAYLRRAGRIKDIEEMSEYEDTKKALCICGWEIEDAPYESWEECGNCDRKLDSLVGLRNLYQQIADWRTCADTLVEALEYWEICPMCGWEKPTHDIKCMIGNALAKYKRMVEGG